MSTLLQKLYGYHVWANRDLFDKLQTLDPERNKAELHAALRLINHYYVVARIFAAHLAGARHDYTDSNTVETPTLEELCTAVAACDQWYLGYLRQHSPGDLSRATSFTFTDGDQGYMTKEEMLTHIVLHSAYHRGEVGRILRQSTVTPPWDTFAVHLHQSEPVRRLQGSGQTAPA